MSRTAQARMYADFSNGLISEANPLQFPDGAIKGISNFIINSNGTLSKRGGLKEESPFTSGVALNSFSEIQDKAVSCANWEFVGGDPNKNVAVVQVGGDLYMFDLDASGVDTSSIIWSDSAFSNNKDVPMSYAVADNRLFIAHPSREPFAVEHDGNNSFSYVRLDIKVRDTELWIGVDDYTTGYGNRSTSISAQHEYNLRNGGWPLSTTVVTADDTNENTESADPVKYCQSIKSFYPSISIPFHFGENGVGKTAEIVKSFNPARIQEDSYFGNSKPPVGTNIVYAEDWERKGQATLVGESFQESSISFQWDSYPSLIAFYAQRLWYAGQTGYSFQETLNNPFGFGSSSKTGTYEVSNTIYFSQQITGDLDEAERCLQQNDPTAQELNQLLPTDGGTISIKGMGRPYKLIPYGTSLMILADNGVWAVYGTDRNSFQADSYSVDKISSYYPISRDSIIDNQEHLFFLSEEAVHVIQSDSSTGLPVVSDLTTQTMKSFYLGIPTESKKKANVTFDRNNKNLYIFYSDGAENLGLFGELGDRLHNKVLIYNSTIKAFYVYDLSIGDSSAILSTLVTDKKNTQSVEDFSKMSLLTFSQDSGTFSMGFTSFRDFTSHSDLGTPFTAFVETGFDSAEDIMRDSMKAPAIISHMEKTEDGFEVNPEDPDGEELVLTNPSSCLLSYGWDWATKYRNSIQIYRFNRDYIPSGVDSDFNYGVDVITSRNRIRGKGTSLGIRLDSEEGKHCNVLGLGLVYTKRERI